MVSWVTRHLPTFCNTKTKKVGTFTRCCSDQVSVLSEGKGFLLQITWQQFVAEATALTYHPPSNSMDR
uniref:Uncharacterized protein n=1 Tax=Romanomermis culicivorax TaxID=13658 RepID=A0A915IYH1_ROMCU